MMAIAKENVNRKKAPQSVSFRALTPFNFKCIVESKSSTKLNENTNEFELLGEKEAKPKRWRRRMGEKLNVIRVR